jgi:uncharacterized protein
MRRKQIPSRLCLWARRRDQRLAVRDVRCGRLDFRRENRRRQKASRCDGAGGLEVAPGKALMDADGFPEAFKADARPADVFSQDSRRSPISTGYFFVRPQTRTGHFRLGGHQLLRDAQDKSHIPMEDFAIAMVDEVEKAARSRQRFTVGS